MGTRKHADVAWVNRSFEPGAADSFGVVPLQDSLRALSEAIPFVGAAFPGVPVPGDLWVDTTSGTLKQRTAAGAWVVVTSTSLATTLFVYAGGQYSTLSAALAAITTASATNRYSIWVFGQVVETTVVSMKPFVDILGFNALVVVDSPLSSVHGISASTAGNWTLRNLSVTRMGALTGASACIALSLSVAANDATVLIENVTVRQECSIASGTPSIYGLLIQGGASPVVRNCNVTMASPIGHAFTVAGTSATNPLVEGGRFVAPAALAYAAIGNQTTTRGTFRGCVFDGGPGAYGGLMTGQAAPTFEDCTFLGGAQAAGYACYSQYGSVPRFKNCRFVGGPTGSGHAFLAANSAAPVLANCVSTPGAGGSGGAYAFDSNSRARMSQCVANVPLLAAVAQAFSASGTFALDATRPAQLESLAISVDVAAPGATVSIGTTAGGTNVVAAQSCAVAGLLDVAFGVARDHVLAAGGLLYVTLVGAATVTVTWVAALALTSGYGLQIQAATVTGWIDGCTFVGSAGGTGIRFNGNPSGDFRISNSLAQARNRSDVARLKGATAAAAFANAPLHRCVFVGGTTNLTVAAGVANGSNIEA